MRLSQLGYEYLITQMVEEGEMKAYERESGRCTHSKTASTMPESCHGHGSEIWAAEKRRTTGDERVGSDRVMDVWHGDAGGEGACYHAVSQHQREKRIPHGRGCSQCAVVRY